MASTTASSSPRAGSFLFFRETHRITIAGQVYWMTVAAAAFPAAIEAK